jgi:Protein of unknown function (DUF3102)
MQDRESIAPSIATPLSESSRQSMRGQSGFHASVNSVASRAKLVVNEKEPRPLEVIAGELNSVLKREAADIIRIGGLLVEAKAQLSHGQWLPWLAEHFPLSKSSVANYVNVYKFAIKFPKVGNLKIHPSALYMLASGLFNTKEIATILKKAETEWVDAGMARKIKLQAKPQLRTSSESFVPPSRSPGAVPLRRDTSLRERFAAAVQELEKLKAEPSAKFAGVVSAARLRLVCSFLSEVATIPGNAA